MRAALYCRVSTEQQAERYSLLSQRRILSEFAERQQWACEIYEDAGISGETIDARPAIQRLLADARSRRIQIALAVEMERFSRSESLFDWLLIKQAFREGKVRFGTPAQLFDPADTEDDFLTDLFGALAKREKRKIVERTRRGRLEAARKGSYQGYYVPYGYHRVGRGQLAVYEPEARVVRQMFAWLLEGNSANRVAQMLQDHGERPRHSAVWSRSVVVQMIRNPAYVGRSRYNRHDWSGVKRGDGPARKRPEDDWVVVPVPRIIADEAFDLAQAQLRQNALLSPRRQQQPYLLKSLVWCGACGVRMQGTVANEHRRYRCGRLHRTAVIPSWTCSVRSIAAVPLEAVVWAEVVAMLRDPAAVLEAARLDRETHVQERDELRMRLAAVQVALQQTPAQRDRVLSAFREGWATADETKRQLAELDRKQHALWEDRERIETRLAGRVAGEAESERLEATLAHVAHRLDTLTAVAREQVVRAVVRGVIVHPNRDVEIQAYVPASEILGQAAYVEMAWRHGAGVTAADQQSGIGAIGSTA